MDDTRDDTTKLRDLLFHELADAECVHDAPCARRVWAELQALPPQPREAGE